MKRFIIISLMAITVLPMMGCIWIDNHNSYLFRVCNDEDFSSRMDKITINNWKAYLGVTKDYWWFDAEEVIKYASSHGDNLMVSYVNHLKDYLDCARQVRYEMWDYPTKEDIQERNQKLGVIRSYAQSKLKTKLRSQHALLFMRCNMIMGRHQENITFWEQTASQYIETVYKDMMLNIYAGALYKSGRLDEAGRIFAQQADWNSLMTQYYKKRSFAAIRHEYQRDPNSAVLPFLLQDFVNNAQEAIDGSDEHEGGFGGKLFIRDIKRSEAEQMWQFAGQVVRDGKTNDPALWKSAQAWLEYLFGNRRQALSDITEALSLDGTQQSKDVARIISIYIKSDVTPVSKNFEAWLADEFDWLSADGRYFAKDRLVHQVLVPKYQQAGRESTVLALYRSVNAYQYDDMIDTMRVEKLISFLDYPAANHNSAFDNYLKRQVVDNEAALTDLIGTKYLRLCEWQKAIDWFQKVPQIFYRNASYAVYVKKRRVDVEPWVKRQWLKDADYAQQYTLTTNPKADFARQMQKMEGELSVLSGQARYQRCYDLAVRYAQAHYEGDCWYLTRRSKSAYIGETPNEVDFAQKANYYLREAEATKDRKLKERVLFAESYVYLNPDRWFTEEWNDAANEVVRIPQPNTRQYKALARLAEFERQNGSSISQYVTLCDEYVTFCAKYK